MPPFVHEEKIPGDLIRSADWNLVGNEVVRLGADKISRAGEESLEGPLTVRGTLTVAGTAANGVGLSLKGELTVGTPTAGAAVRILRRQEDGKAATDGALVLGTDSTSSGALRMGYYSTYSWLQGQGQQAIAINPHGGNVGIGTGATAPTAKLHVAGDALLTGYLYFGNRSTLTPDQGGSLELGGDNGTAGTGTPYIDFHFKDKKEDFNVRLINDDNGTLTLAGGVLRLQNDREIMFTDNGQIRSADNNHRILFRRSENKLELREWGDIVFSPGAKDGNETAKAVLTAGGQLSIGNKTPPGGHTLYVEGGEVHSGGGVAGYSFANRGSPYTPGGGTGDRWVLYSQDRIARLWSGGDKLTVTADGNVGIGTGTTAPTAKLHVGGDALVTGALSFGSAVRQMVNLWGAQYGIGVQSGTTYLRTGDSFAFYKGGSHNDTQFNAGGGTALAILGGDGTLQAGAFRFGNGSLLKADQGGSIELGGDNNTAGKGTPYIDFHFKDKQEDYNVRLINDADRRLTLAGGALRLDANQEIFFADNGQIRSADDNHRILFRRNEDIMELREFGRIVFSPGSRDGKETAKATLDPAGTFTCVRLAQSSTREIKRDIAPLDQGYAADLLAGLEPVRYRMIEDPDGDEHLGFVAEEVPDALACADHRSIHPGYIVAVLTRVVKEQQRRLDELTYRLEQGLSA